MQSRSRAAWIAALTALAVLAATVGVAGAAKIRERSQEVAIPAGETAKQVVRCKRGHDYVAGGFDSPAEIDDFTGPFNLTNTSRRAGDRGHRTTAHNFGAATGPHKAFVYCARRGYDLSKRAATARIPVLEGLGGGESATATARCPRRHRVVSGGFTVTGVGAAEPEVFVHESRRAGKRGWRVSAANTAETEKKVKAFAYCKRGKGAKLKQRSATGDTAFPDPTVDLTVSCRPGERAISWGFRSTSFGFTESERALPLAAYRASRGAWFVEAVRKGLLDQEFTAYVYCR